VDRKAEIEARFGTSARAYAESPGHRGGPDLDRMLELAAPQGTEAMLDLATGAGNTALAFAPRVRRIVALDLADGMIAETMERFAQAGLTNAEFVVQDAERLPFSDASFDLVTCRIAPHHFLDVAASTREVFRVLRPRGRYLLEDSLAPDDEEAAVFLHDAESQRDPTHFRSLSRREWREAFRAAGFVLEHEEVFPKRHDLGEWLDRGGAPETTKQKLRFAFAHASPRVRAVLAIGGSPAPAFTDEKILLAGRRP
jgi:ubiquinone/menaquinone biosynthesis C-methylase UbiE